MLHVAIQLPPRLKSTAALLATAFVLTTAWPAAGLAADTATLTVTFSDLKTPSGAVMVALSASQAAYEGQAAPAGQAIAPVSGGGAIASFAGLVPGTYAIRAFHDLNGDGKLGVSPFGVPTEPYAFSNNAQGVMGPAKWPAAAFEVKAGDNQLTIAID